MTNPAFLAADLLETFTETINRNPGVGLVENEYQDIAKASGYLTQVTTCIDRMEMLGDDVAPIRDQMPTLWGCATRYTPAAKARPAIGVLRMFGNSIRRAGIITDFTQDTVAAIREALENLDELVRGEPSLTGHLRDQLLMLIADAMKASNDFDLLDPMSFDQTLSDVFMSGVRYASTFKTEPEKAARFMDALRALARELGVNVASDSLTALGGFAVGSITGG